ncbi:MAG: DUF3604 domain-containing protein [Myxococcales bacterium]|nr:DUF3604 domain-containing protein [Myxococcales bacterium]MDH3485488.1 DUF3604 domain-containing protein [Myxococcales bacterium]
MSRSLFFALSAFVVTLIALGCGGDSGGPGPDVLGRCAEFDELRQPFFGDTHIHTVLSLDANLQGTRPGPMEAYAFAKGTPIGVQPYDADGNPLRTATPDPDRRLDFVMLSDHAEYLGTIAVCNDPNSPAYDRPADPDARPDDVGCIEYRTTNPAEITAVFRRLNALTALAPDDTRYPALCGDSGTECIEAGIDVWAQVQDAAEAAYDRSDSCDFTSFVGYEWSAGPLTANLHRNVMFRNDVVPELPISYFDEPYVEDLWAGLRDECIDTDTGCDALAIPHNSNLAAGTFFERPDKNGNPFDASYAQLRHDLEPVIEIFQHKGASECLPGQAISDELCGFEILPYANLANVNLQDLQLFGDADPRDFVRGALGEGMKLELELGVNPFQHGIISSTDTHIAAPGYDNEKTFLGHGGAGQPNRELPAPEGFPDVQYLNPGGPAGVWAEENSRNAIFEAFRRREVFGTSGPRIVPRVFGGWDLPTDLCDSPELSRIGYEQGVPMGGELSDPPDGSMPKFLVSAKQDPMSAPLQRIQIIKGWLEGGDYRVQVFDYVAGDPNNTASVDLATCEPQGTGAADLCTVWEDESFDPTQPAYYYVRVIENPTCRWTAQQCVDANYDCDNPTTQFDFDCCDPTAGLNVAFCDDVAAGLTGGEAACCRTDNPTSSTSVSFCNDVAGTLPPADGQCCRPRLEGAIQERAWTSPIWYQPPS